MNKFIKLIIMVVVSMTTAFLLFPKGVFDFQKRSIKLDNPLMYHQNITTINGNQQVINILEVKPQDERVQIFPILSQDSIFGFEKTSEIAKRIQAKAAVNGGFFHIYGQPSGITIINGKLLCTPWQKSSRPIFLTDEDGIAHMLDVTIEIWVETEHAILSIDGVNREPKDDEIILYTPEYGLTTRTNGIETFSKILQNEIVTNSLMTKMEVEIPQNGMVLTATGEKINRLKEYVEISNGSTITLEYKVSPIHNQITHAFEGGFWVVKDGIAVVKQREAWVGLTTNREPRTIVGLKDDGIVVFLTIDGRQQEYSVGVTGDELAQFLISLGINNALMLDGGASTTMVVDGEIVNKPSYRGRERMVGGAICIVYDE